MSPAFEEIQRSPVRPAGSSASVVRPVGRGHDQIGHVPAQLDPGDPGRIVQGARGAAATLLGERIHPVDLIGGTLVVGGVLLGLVRPHPAADPLAGSAERGRRHRGEIRGPGQG